MDFFKDHSYKVPNRIIQTLLSNINCEIYSPDQVIKEPQDDIEHIFLIRYGAINVFDEHYNYMHQLIGTQFFGLYQCMFDLKSGCYFRTQSANKLNDQSILLTIHKYKFLEVVCQHENYSVFKHFHDTAIGRFKYVSQ